MACHSKSLFNISNLNNSSNHLYSSMLYCIMTLYHMRNPLARCIIIIHAVMYGKEADKKGQRATEARLREASPYLPPSCTNSSSVGRRFRRTCAGKNPATRSFSSLQEHLSSHQLLCWTQAIRGKWGSSIAHQCFV